MARGGYRPNAGRPKASSGAAGKGMGAKAVAAQVAKDRVELNSLAIGVGLNKVDAIEDRAYLKGMSPLEYMLSVMRDSEEDPNMRARMAIAAAPFMHERSAEVKPGKKELRQDAAKKVADGKFKPGAPPLRVVGASNR